MNILIYSLLVSNLLVVIIYFIMTFRHMLLLFTNDKIVDNVKFYNMLGIFLI
ncbi:hypothetical protein bsdtw1_00247 [Clostridium fungisolvens]|uniref:Uncharacterized protein n=1 Tax=Clostridium fungisolvens TaxID=1604897 RepID=A0A6V8SCA8_9CLOT|nr:hypothetical protein bsdtw1_00247 [Clostridium fungisolvens]